MVSIAPNKNELVAHIERALANPKSKANKIIGIDYLDLNDYNNTDIDELLKPYRHRYSPLRHTNDKGVHEYLSTFMRLGGGCAQRCPCRQEAAESDNNTSEDDDNGVRCGGADNKSMGVAVHVTMEEFLTNPTLFAAANAEALLKKKRVSRFTRQLLRMARTIQFRELLKTLKEAAQERDLRVTHVEHSIRSPCLQLNGVVDVVFQVGANARQVEIWDWKVKSHPHHRTHDYGDAAAPLRDLAVTMHNLGCMQVALYAWMWSTNSPKTWVSGCYVAALYTRSCEVEVEKVSDSHFLPQIYHLVNERFACTIKHIPAGTRVHTFITAWQRNYNALVGEEKI